MKQVDEHTEALLSEISNLYIAAQQTENERIMQGDTFNVFNAINWPKGDCPWRADAAA